MGLLDRFFGPPAPGKFAQRFLELLRHNGFTEELIYDEKNFCLRTAEKGQPSHTFNLGNYYAEHCQIPRSERAEHVRRIVIGALTSQKDLPDEYEDAKPDLRLRLWCRAAIDKLSLQRQIDGEDAELTLALDNVGEHLYTSVVFDFPDSVRTVDKDDFENWGVSVYEAMEDAKSNLIDDEFAFASIGESLYASVTGDSYDASRILLLDLIRQLPVQGDHIVMVPNRDSLLITGCEDDDGLEMMLDMAEEATEQPRPMLFMPLRLEGDTWVDWLPPTTHRLHDRFRLLELKYMYPEYHEQKELLDTLHEQNATDVFVASLTAVESDGGRVSSYCVWSKDVDTLLPKASVVAFFEEEKGIVASGDWNTVVDTVGELMENTDFYPPRFRVRTFPTEQQLAAIGNEGL